MRAYTFRLEALLRVRRSQALVARQGVARSLRLLEQARAEEATASGAYEAFVGSGPLDSDAFVARAERGGRLAAAVAEAQAVRRHGDRVLEEAREQAVRAERNVALLEKLDQRRRAEWQIGSVREDTATMDEFAAARTAITRLGDPS